MKHIELISHLDIYMNPHPQGEFYQFYVNTYVIIVRNIQILHTPLGMTCKEYIWIIERIRYLKFLHCSTYKPINNIHDINT